MLQDCCSGILFLQFDHSAIAPKLNLLILLLRLRFCRIAGIDQYRLFVNNFYSFGNLGNPL